MSGQIWLEKRVKELETKLDEVSKDRDDWARKYQELGLSTHFTHVAWGHKLVTHNDGSISITPAEKK